jgi:hypothetical protein
MPEMASLIEKPKQNIILPKGIGIDAFYAEAAV